MTGDELRTMVLERRQAAAERAADTHYDKRTKDHREYIEHRVRLSAAQSVALEHAVGLADRIVALEAAVERDGVTVAGSTGQTKLHPALGELRASREELRELTQKLGPGGR